MEWHYAQDGKPVGPISDLDLANLIKHGKIASDTLVWHQGMENWAKYCDVTSAASTAAPTNTNQPSSAQGNTPNKDLMAQGLAAVRGSWGLAIGVMVVYWIISTAGAIVPYLGNLISLFISGPFMLGLATFFLALTRGEEHDFNMLFSGFSRFWQAVLTNLLMSIFLGLLAMLFVVPAVVLAIFVGAGGRLAGNEVLFFAVGIPLLIPLMIPMIMASYAFAMTFYILADNTEVSAYDAIMRSVKMMRGMKWKLFCLGLRFLGWMILALFTCGIGFLWLAPYITTTMARFYDDVKGRAVTSV